MRDRSPSHRGDSDPTADLALANDREALREEARQMVSRMVTPPHWHAFAACLGVDVNLFFPERGQSTTEAKAICQRCAVVPECLAEALADPDLDYGVRAGLSAQERKRLRAEGA
jgi:Transcription factor WhiB.